MWTSSLFDELGEYWREIADARSTNTEVELIDALVKTEGLILDLCCGTGRHSILLREKGWNIIGVDMSKNLLRIAKGQMFRKKVCLPIVRAEMRHLPFRPQSFAAVINMFTSFGYLPSLKEDLKCLGEIERILGQHGQFLVDIANRDHLLQAFKKKDWGQFPQFYMLEKRSLSADGSKLHSEWTIIDKKSGNTRAFVHNLRLYTFQQLRKMLRKSGFQTREAFGDYNGTEFTQASPRLILLAQKREAL